jgi:predicted small lipoprotein YifL
MRLTSLLLVALLLFAGCGKKGSLTLPDKPQPSPTQPVQK